MEQINKLSDFLSKYFILLVIAVSLGSILEPEPFIKLNKIKLFEQSLINIGLGFIMFIMGVTLNFKDIKLVFTRFKDVFIGCAAQYIVMPLVAFMLAKIFNLPPAFAIGLVLLGTCPGGTISNVMTYMAKGDTALSVALTTVSTFISPILTPFLTMVLAGAWLKIDAKTMFFSIIQIVLLPTILGILVRFMVKDSLEKFTKAFVIFPIIIVVLINGMCVAPNRENLLNSSFILIVAVCLHNWIGYFIGYMVGSLAKMSSKQKKTISIEVGLQNASLAIGLSSQFSNPLCALPSAIAVVIHLISSSLLANIFSKDLNFKKFIFVKKTQYE
ncbi:bile acid:sodium symporter family protein [Cetobacterium sp.]|uniref:bile acid:sodium symporter family protein n=1 Tax=Cetobacterium sp. TaxID=2071632 RepID=UPI003AF1DE21